MRLVKFNGQNGRIVWVNPDRVCLIREDDHGRGAMIAFDHETFALVEEPPEDVASVVVSA